MLNYEISSNNKHQKLVAVVVPLSFSNKLTTDEEISLRHLIHYLDSYDKYLVVPRNHLLDIEGFKKRNSIRNSLEVQQHIEALYFPLVSTGLS